MFNETRLLDSVSYGSEFGQEFKTNIVTLKSGQERRNINWTVPLGRYSINYSALLPADHLAVYHAHMASFGSAIPFRFRDWLDYQATGEEIGIGTGAAQTLQLIKTYSFGPLEIVRNITKPTAVCKVYADGVEISATVDTTTGLATVTAGFDEVITWTGEFDVPVRFDDDRLDCQPVNKSGGSFVLSSNVTLTEVRL